MVDAPYGNLDVLNLIIHISYVDTNHYCGLDKTTALHCVASSGFMNVIEAIEILLFVGANPNNIDASDDHPTKASIVPHKLSNIKVVLEDFYGAVSAIHHQALRNHTLNCPCCSL